jgi:hypothetical protein
MKVKIGDNIYDSDEQPIMLIMSQREKNLISHMCPSDTKFCVYPEDMNEGVIIKFMRDGRKLNKNE